MSQNVVSRSAGLIQGSTAVSPDMLNGLQTTLEGMDLGPLLGLWLQSSVIGLTMQALGIIIYGASTFGALQCFLKEKP